MNTTNSPIKDLANQIVAEALRRAVLNIDSFAEDDMKPHRRKALRMSLAKRYDKLVEKFGLDTHELLAETVAANDASPTSLSW